MIEDCNDQKDMQIWVENGIIHTCFAKNLHFSLEIAKKFARCRKKLASGRSLPVLIDWSNIIGVDREARIFLARQEAGRFLSAGAFLVETRMQKLICDALFMINRPEYPVAQFYEKQQALGWLHHFKFLN